MDCKLLDEWVNRRGHSTGHQRLWRSGKIEVRPPYHTTVVVDDGLLCNLLSKQCKLCMASRNKHPWAEMDKEKFRFKALPLDENKGRTLFVNAYKRWGMAHRGPSASIWICPWLIENLIPLRLSARNSCLLGVYWVFLAAHIFLVRKLWFFFGTP